MASPSPATHPAPAELSITCHFAPLKDPRRRHRRLHHLQDIIVVALCGVIAGAQDWQEIVTFGRKRPCSVCLPGRCCPYRRSR